MVATVRRRSPRLASLGVSPRENEKHPEVVSKTRKSTKVPRAKPSITDRHKKEGKTPDSRKVWKKKDATKKTKVSNNKDTSESSSVRTSSCEILPRSRENALKETGYANTWIMGIDEAGRGPLAGPVVAAAAVVPVDIPGITDSKKITCENTREDLYNEIVTSSDVTWAVAVVDAPRIDEINILQATMQAMSMAASALVVGANDNSSDSAEEEEELEVETKWKETTKHSACASRKGCYVACGGRMLKPQRPQRTTSTTNDDKNKTPPISTGIKGSKSGEEEGDTSTPPSYYALIDGNRIPKDLPCMGESIVKGDSKEYSIAAASILAKVTRDRLMHSYDKLYPQYKLGKHKGYPTREHMAAVFEFGASPIHRRTFAPLKHMEFDGSGNVVSSS